MYGGYSSNAGNAGGGFFSNNYSSYNKTPVKAKNEVNFGSPKVIIEVINSDECFEWRTNASANDNLSDP